MLNVTLSEEKYLQGTESLLPAVTYIAYIWNTGFFFFKNVEEILVIVLKFHVEVKYYICNGLFSYSLLHGSGF